MAALPISPSLLVGALASFPGPGSTVSTVPALPTLRRGEPDTANADSATAAGGAPATNSPFPQLLADFVAAVADEAGDGEPETLPAGLELTAAIRTLLGGMQSSPVALPAPTAGPGVTATSTRGEGRATRPRAAEPEAAPDLPVPVATPSISVVMPSVPLATPEPPAPAGAGPGTSVVVPPLAFEAPSPSRGGLDGDAVHAVAPACNLPQTAAELPPAATDNARRGQSGPELPGAVEIRPAASSLPGQKALAWRSTDRQIYSPPLAEQSAGARDGASGGQPPTLNTAAWQNSPAPLASQATVHWQAPVVEQAVRIEPPMPAQTVGSSEPAQTPTGISSASHGAIELPATAEPPVGEAIEVPASHPEIPTKAREMAPVGRIADDRFTLPVGIPPAQVVRMAGTGSAGRVQQRKHTAWGDVQPLLPDGEESPHRDRRPVGAAFDVAPQKTAETPAWVAPVPQVTPSECVPLADPVLASPLNPVPGGPSGLTPESTLGGTPPPLPAPAVEAQKAEPKAPDATPDAGSGFPAGPTQTVLDAPDAAGTKARMGVAVASMAPANAQVRALAPGTTDRHEVAFAVQIRALPASEGKARRESPAEPRPSEAPRRFVMPAAERAVGAAEPEAIEVRPPRARESEQNPTRAGREREPEVPPADDAARAPGGLAEKAIPPQALDSSLKTASGRSDAPQPSKPASPQEAARSESRPEAVKSPPLHDMKFEVSGGGERRVEVRVSERAGEVRMTVRTPDADLAGALRENLPALSARLAGSGLPNDTWHPATASSHEWRHATASAAGGAPQDADTASRHPQDESQKDAEQQRSKSPHEAARQKEKGKDFAWLMSTLR